MFTKIEKYEVGVIKKKNSLNQRGPLYIYSSTDWEFGLYLYDKFKHSLHYRCETINCVAACAILCLDRTIKIESCHIDPLEFE